MNRSTTPKCPKCSHTVTFGDFASGGRLDGYGAETRVIACNHCGWSEELDRRVAHIARLTPHPVAAMFPMLADGKLRELAEDIRTNGLHSPIVHLGDVLLDGRNRLAACRMVGVVPRLRDFARFARAEFEARGEDVVVRWIVSVNVHRRHLDESQRARIGKRIATLEQGRPGSESGRSAGIPTQAEVAKMMNVSERLIREAGVVEDRGSPDLVRAVDSGEVTVSAAAEIARSTSDHAEQNEILARPTAERRQVVRELRERRRESTKAKPAPPVALAAGDPIPPADPDRDRIVEIVSTKQDVTPARPAETTTDEPILEDDVLVLEEPRVVPLVQRADEALEAARRCFGGDDQIRLTLVVRDSSGRRVIAGDDVASVAVR